jgi:hypothetical protein
LVQSEAEDAADDDALLVAIGEILFCSICSIAFDQKDEYGKHLNTHCVELQNAEGW